MLPYIHHPVQVNEAAYGIWGIEQRGFDALQRCLGFHRYSG